MGDVTDDAEQTPTPTPSPQLFARGGATGQRPADPAAPPTSGSELAGETASRFPSTGDPRVDQALAQLPDPSQHDRASTASTGHATADAASDGGDNDGGDNTVGEGADGESTSDGLGLPDPALLDSHVADVTSVHRQLQQRLSDLSS